MVDYLCGLGRFGDGLAVVVATVVMPVLSGVLVGRLSPQWSMLVLVVACHSRSVIFPIPFVSLLRLLSVG